MRFDPGEFERNSVRRVPFRQEVFDLIPSLVKDSRIWVDTGCGTGLFSSIAMEHFPDTRFILADPSEEMLSVAQQRFPCDNVKFVQCPTHELDVEADVITAMFSHHYYDETEKRKMLSHCHDLLNDGGMYISVEHRGYQSSDERDSNYRLWRRFQKDNGITEEESDEFFGRFGRIVFPFSVDEHQQMLSEAGFREISFFFLTYSCIGVCARK